MAEAKTRRLLLLGGVMLLNLAPGAVGDAPSERAGLPARPPRPGLIAVSAAELIAEPGGLELVPPDLVALALRADGGVGLEGTDRREGGRALPPVGSDGDLESLGAVSAARPVAEAPAAALLWLALGAWLAARGSEDRG